jgi:hypothetical protein
LSCWDSLTTPALAYGGAKLMKRPAFCARRMTRRQPQTCTSNPAAAGAFQIRVTQLFETGRRVPLPSYDDEAALEPVVPSDASAPAESPHPVSARAATLPRSLAALDQMLPSFIVVLVLCSIIVMIAATVWLVRVLF